MMKKIFLFFPEKIWHFMSNPLFFFLKKKTKKKTHQFVVCGICPESGKG